MPSASLREADRLYKNFQMKGEESKSIQLCSSAKNLDEIKLGTKEDDVSPFYFQPTKTD